MWVQGGSELLELSHQVRIRCIKDGNTEPHSVHLYLAESLMMQIKNDSAIWGRTEQMHIKEA